jgi:5-deoxy-glucuronate isomerase
MTQPLPAPTGHGAAVKRTPLVEAGADARYIGLELVEAGAGATVELAAGRERLAVIMSGRGAVRLDGADLGTLGGRATVFEGPGDALYLPPDSSASLTVADGEAVIAVAAAEPGGDPPGKARAIRPVDQRIATVGRGAWERTVRTILGPEQPASRLLAGETVNPPGLWSSFPPHRHDRDSAEEAALEEVYLYRVHPENGFGVQIRYDSDAESEARMVCDCDVAVIASGFHPVAAAPGHQLYYLWVMAGEHRVMRPYIDPRYRWVEQGP